MSRPEPTEAAPRPRLLFLNRSYWPDVEATGQLLTELCEALASRFDVTVVPGQPNGNPSKTGYRRIGRSSHNGVHIRRVFHTRFPKRNTIGRLVNGASYQLMATIHSLVLPRPDVIVAETDPPWSCLLGLLLRRRFHCPLVVYLQDIYPDVAVAVGKLSNRQLTNWLRRILYTAYRKADLVVVPSQDMRQTILDLGVAQHRVAYVPNWADTQLVRPVKRDNPFRLRHGLSDRFVVMYSGNIGLTQRLETVLAAAHSLRDRRDILFLVVGDGASRYQLVEEANRLGLSNVHFHGYQRKDELADSLSAADVHLVPLAPELASCLMPSKLYGILASGTPVIALAPRQCELARVVDRHGVGVVIPPGDPMALAETLRWCAASPQRLAQMGAAARRLAVRRYDREHSVAMFENLLDDVSRRSELPAA